MTLWRNVRLDMDAYRMLMNYRDRLSVSVFNNPDRYPANLAEGRVSVSQALRMLLSTQQKRTRRAAKSKKARKAAKRPAKPYNATTGPQDGPPVLLPLRTTAQPGGDA